MVRKIASFKKPVMGQRDLAKYWDKNNRNYLSYFNSRNFFNRFFEIFGIEICFDHSDDIIKQDHLKELIW